MDYLRDIKTAFVLVDKDVCGCRFAALDDLPLKVDLRRTVHKL